MGAFLDIPKQKAEQDEENQMKKVEALVKLLEAKLEVFENKIQLLRGQSGEKNDSQVAGGRTVQQIKQLRAVSEEGIDKQVLAGVNEFFTSASAAVDNNDEGKTAKHAAIHGAKNMLIGVLNGLLGAAAGTSSETSSFCVLFLNNAFVRIDYFFYYFNVTGTAYGYTAARHGFCSFLELRVLEMKNLKLDEINFFLTQSFAENEQDLRTLQAFRFELARLYTFSKLLDAANEKMDLEQLNKLKEQIQKSWEASSSLYANLTDYVPLPPQPPQHQTLASGKIPPKDVPYPTKEGEKMVPKPDPAFHDRG